MPLADFLTGLALLALTTGAALAFATVVVRRRVDTLAGAPRALAGGILATLAFVAIHLVPGTIGVLGKPSVAVAAVIVLLAAAFMPRAEERPLPDPGPAAPASGRAAWTLALATAGLVTAYLVAFAADSGGLAATQADMTTFHLPRVARWIQDGSFWHIAEFAPHWSVGTYPSTSDVVLLGAVLPFDNEFLVRFVNYPAVALTALAVYALAAELGASRASAVSWASAFVAMPVVMTWAVDGLSDTYMLATFVSGVVFLTRHLRTRARADLVLGALGLGIAFGTKWYAPAAVIMALAGWGLAGLLRRDGLRAVGGRVAAALGIVSVTGGFWLLRNLVETGNPVFPQKVALGGLVVFDAPRDIRRDAIGFTLADYLGQPRIWREVLWPTFLPIMSWVAIALWAALLVGCVLALRLGRDRAAPPPVVGLCSTAVAIALVYLVTPFTAMGFEGAPVAGAVNARYVVPALAIAAALGAWAGGRLGHRVRLAAGAVLLIATADALRRVPHVSLAAWVVGLVVVVLAAGVVLWLREPRRRATLLRPAPAAALVLAFAVVALAGLDRQEQRFNDHRYAGGDATVQWVNANARSGRRIGVVGEGFSVVYPMFGPRLGNHVEYTGPVVDGMLRTYRRRAAFDRALTRGRYDLVLVQGGAGVFDPGLPAKHEQWLAALGFRRVAAGLRAETGGQPVSLYRAAGR